MNTAQLDLVTRLRDEAHALTGGNAAARRARRLLNEAADFIERHPHAVLTAQGFVDYGATERLRKGRIT